MANKTYVFDGPAEQLQQIDQLIKHIVTMYEKDSASLMKVVVYKKTISSSVHKKNKQNIKLMSAGSGDIDKIYLGR